MRHARADLGRLDGGAREVSSKWSWRSQLTWEATAY